MILQFKKLYMLSKEISFGNKFFLLGIFFLPSAFPIGAFLLLISLILSFISSHIHFLKDKWNYPILITLGIILISTINVTFLDLPKELIDYKKSFIWINLFNWIPSLFGFWGFQKYLETSFQRIIFCKFILFGTLPILFSCISQYIFKIYGPFSTMYELIIWFQRPLISTGGVTGLFNNPNYLAFWLSITLPFAIIFFKKSKNSFEKIFFFIVSINIFVFTFLTNSRNGFFSLIIILIAFYGFKKISSITFSSILFLSITEIVFRLFLPSISFSKFISSNTLLIKISNINFNYESLPRYMIWKNSLNLILQRPILGWGGSTFPHINNYVNNNSENFIDAQHTHNIFFELAHNFGIPISILLLVTISLLLIKLFRSINLSLSKDKLILIDKGWAISTFLVLLLHTFDISYYDGKINLLISILFAGARCIIKPIDNFPQEKSITYL